MAADKNVQLSITLRTVDHATAKIKAVNDRIAAATKPMKDFQEQMSKLRGNLGLDNVVDGFKGVGTALGDLLGKLTLVGGVAGAAVFGMKALIDGFDNLGDKAEQLGVGVDWLSQTEFAAKKAGAAVENLDSGVSNFTKGLGQARAGTGRMAAFLGKVSPALLKQLKGAKSNEQAFDLLADAMAKLEDPAKRAALATATVGDATLAPLLAKGSAGINEFRKQSAKATGPLGGAVAAAGSFGDAMDNLDESLKGVKARLVEGITPALTKIVEKMGEWLLAHRADIAQWAKDIGERLPGAVEKVVAVVQKVWDKVTGFVDAVGGLKNVAIGAAAIMAGPLVLSVVKLGGALATTIARVAQLRSGLGAVTGAGGAGVAAGAAGAAGTAAKGGALAAAGPIGATIAAASFLNDISGGSIGGEGDGARSQLDIAREMLLKRPEFASRTQRWEEFLGKRPDMTAQVQAARVGAGVMQPQKIVVDFNGVPRGTRVNTDPKNTADMDLNLGYQLLGSM